MNVMIMSPGRRVEIVEYFKKELSSIGGKVFTLDMNPLTPALYFSDKYFCIEKNFDDLRPYMMNALDICVDNKVDCVLTLIDPELVLLSDYREYFEAAGIKVMISDKEIVNATFDKLQFYQYFRDIIPVIWTTQNKNDVVEQIWSRKLDFPVFAKPRKGSGSAGLVKLMDMVELQRFEPQDEYIYQPYAKDKEYGVDLYFDMASGCLQQVFIKEKKAMRSGETDKSESIHNERISEIVNKLDKRGLKGVIDMDVFLAPDGHYYVNEINPRFGGGYPHAYHCGVNLITCIINDLQGNAADNMLRLEYEDGITMMKYNNYYFTDNKI